MAVIQTSTEILEQDQKLSESSRESLNKIRRATTQLTDLVDSLLFLARGSTSQKDSLINEELNISDLLQQQVEEHRSSFHHHAVSIVTDITEDIKTPVAETHLTMIINNLISNAFQHTQEGTITITLRDEFLSIKDTVRGIDPSEKEHIFEKNFSSHFSQGIGRGFISANRYVTLMAGILKLTVNQA